MPKEEKDFSKEFLLEVYLNLLKPRMVEECMLNALRQGKISKWFSAWGQEAVSVGATMALNPKEYICTVHRNLGVFTTRNIPYGRLFSQFQGKLNGFTKGRDRSFHFGTHEYKIIGMISHLASQMGVADGIALANKLSDNQQVCLVFCGDGGSSEGDFHEALNLAAVWQLPVIIIIEANHWGLSTPSSEQFRMNSFVDKGMGYGIEAESIDGNDILEVYQTIHKWAQEIRENPRPVLIECRTFRMRGHEEASGTAYYPKGLIEKWEEKDPVLQYENFLYANGLISKKEIEEWKHNLRLEIEDALKESNKEADILPNDERELNEVYAPFSNNEIKSNTLKNNELRFIDAISEGLDMALQKHPNLYFMGQDIAEYGGAFKVTKGFVEKYGKNRIKNTPLCEAAIIGTALGMSIMGNKSMVEMQFSDFVSEGFNQIVNNLAKTYYRWGQAADVVIRMPTGAGLSAGPFHSQSTEAWFTKVPGLKVVYPAFPEDAKGLLLQSFEDPNPILFFEHKKLYRSIKAAVPEGHYTLPFGKARCVNKGTDLSIITYGLGVHWALELQQKLPHIAMDIIDLRTLQPLDIESLLDSVKRTGKVIILHEDTLTSGFGGELAALIAENCFEFLDAPIVRVASLDTPIPFATSLEKKFLPEERLEQEVLKLYKY